MKFNAKKLFWRAALYALGLLILAFGVAFSVNSDLGVSPVNSLPYVLSLITGYKLGTCVVAVFSVYILVQIVLLRRDFNPINLTQIAFSTLFGYFTDFAKGVLGSWCLPTYAGRLVMLAISIFFVALGISLYVGTKLVNMPMEGMTSTITSKLSGTTFNKVKVVTDCAVVLVSAACSLIFLHGLYGVREGTVLCALLVGIIMKPIQKALEPVFGKLCFEEEQPESSKSQAEA